MYVFMLIADLITCPWSPKTPPQQVHGEPQKEETNLQREYVRN